MTINHQHQWILTPLKKQIIAELLTVKGLVRQIYHQVHEAVGRRITLLDTGVEELKQKVGRSQSKLFVELSNCSVSSNIQIEFLRNLLHSIAPINC